MAPKNSRLRQRHEPHLHGGWVATKQENQWIEVDLLLPRRIFAISTQGKSSIRVDGTRLFQGNVLPRYWGYVEFYTLTSNYIGGFRPVIVDGEQQVRGNSDTDTIVTHEFTARIGRSWRLQPLRIAGSGGLRWDLFGCPFCEYYLVFSEKSPFTIPQLFE